MCNMRLNDWQLIFEKKKEGKKKTNVLEMLMSVKKKKSQKISNIF